MIQGSYTAWLVPLALTLVGLGTGTAKATAQTTYPFEATYNTQITNTPLEETSSGIVLKTTVTGESADAPYSLTNLTIENYARVDTSTGMATYNSDPATFGIEGLPFGTLTLFGDGDDKLFATNRGTASLETGSGSITLSGGESIFTDATGTLDLFQTITSNPDPTGITAPIISPVTISGSFEVVPEPGTEIGTLVGIGLIGAGFLLRRRRPSSTL